MRKGSTHSADAKTAMSRRRKGKQTGSDNPAWKGGQVAEICVRCGSIFRVKPGRRGKQRYCSQICAGADPERRAAIAAAMRSRMARTDQSGVKNANWKGGRARDLQLKRIATQERAWRVQGLHFTEVEYQALAEAQNRLCAICHGPSGVMRLHLDHDHETKEVRGLLCHTCNIGLGMFRDSVLLLEAATNYLKRT